MPFFPTMVRRATIDDLPRLVEMGMAFVEQTAYAQILGPPSPETITQLASQILENPNALALVSENGQGVHGMMGVLLVPHAMSGELIGSEVVWWMDESHRGDGVRMLLDAEKWVRDRGAVMLQMIAPNRRVEQFYERMGYEPIERAYQKRLR